MLRFRRLFLLVTITLFLLAGAAWGQSRPPTSPGPDQPLSSDREDVKTPPEGQRDLPLKDLREKPLRSQEDQAGKSLKRNSPYPSQAEEAGESLKKQQPVKTKPKVSTGKKPGAGKPTSAARQDPFAQETRSEWWPRRDQTGPPELSPLELSRQQDREQDAMRMKLKKKGKSLRTCPKG